MWDYYFRTTARIIFMIAANVEFSFRIANRGRLRYAIGTNMMFSFMKASTWGLASRYHTTWVLYAI